LGYEFGARASMAQHATAPDYHTSGSWGAVTAAAAGAYILQLNMDQTRHALGIAEYHGPRSQMMRCIDHPTMLKDGAGWGSMAGVSAAKLAQAGFTGAPALIVEEASEFWHDLGERWYMLEQYYKPYPVCRWAQAPIEAALDLQRTNGFAHHDVTGLEIETFHEAIRLATSAPETTEQAQYSTSYPVAVALVHGDVTPDAIADDALGDPDVMRLSHMLVMREQDHANAHFPTRRYARAKITLRDGQVLESDWMEPKWDHRTPATAGELTNKFRALAHPVLGPDRATRIETAVNGLEHIELSELTNQLLKPTNQH
jgi:2-methylcitrate dehydratase PrpD